MARLDKVSDSLKRVSEFPEQHDIFRHELKEKIIKSSHAGVHLFFWEIHASLSDGTRPAYKKWLNENQFSLYELNVMIQRKLVVPEAPYKLTNSESLWQEFSFYEIQHDHILFDIGAGNGFISFILALSGLPLQIYTTEVDQGFIKYLHDRMAEPVFQDIQSDIFLISGLEKSLGIKDVKADRIILREVFHHLKHRKEILNDIYQHLTSDGHLLVVEATKDLESKEAKNCPKAVKSSEILDAFENAGFDLIERKTIDGSEFFRYKIK